MAVSTDGGSNDVAGAEPPTAPVRREELIAQLSRELIAVGARRRTQVEALDAEVAELRGHVQELQRRERTQRRRAEQHARQIEDLRTSETWRVGAAALWLPRRIRSAWSSR